MTTIYTGKMTAIYDKNNMSYTWENVRRARALRAQSLTYHEIGLIMGVTRQRVHQLLRYIGKCSDPPRTMPKRIHKCKACGIGGLAKGRRYHEECRPRTKMVTLKCDGCGQHYLREERWIKRRAKDPRYKVDGRNFCKRDCHIDTPSMRGLAYIKCCNDKCEEKIKVTGYMRYRARKGQAFFFHNRKCITRKGRTPVALQ